VKDLVMVSEARTSQKLCMFRSNNPFSNRPLAQTGVNLKQYCYWLLIVSPKQRSGTVCLSLIWSDLCSTWTSEVQSHHYFSTC